MWPVLRAKESAAGCRFQVIAFDEVQFFPRDSGFFQLVKHLLDEGYDVLASGLAFDFRGEPFGSTPDLALLAEDRCMWMTAYCTRCGSRAPYPQRIIDGIPAHYNSPQILVGGDETYEPRCDDHFTCPDVRRGATMSHWGRGASRTRSQAGCRRRGVKLGNL